LTIQLLRGLEGEVRLGHGERVVQTAGGRGGGTGPGYGETLSSLSVDLRIGLTTASALIRLNIITCGRSSFQFCHCWSQVT
jgi:hypothetical protein